VKILYRTIAGSRLYGLEHADSDWDYYTVIDRVPKSKAAYHAHTIVDGIDTTVVDFGTWIADCQANVPQALEAMFSTKADFDQLAFFRSQFRAGTNYDVYYGIMKRMALTPKWDDFKHRRHIMRLALCIRSMRDSGRFDPTLTESQIEFVNWWGNRPMENTYRAALALSRS